MQRVCAALDGCAFEWERLAPEDLLAAIRAAQEAKRRAEALCLTIVAAADKTDVCMRLLGTPLASYMALDGKQDSKQAKREVFDGKDLAKHPKVKQAALAGDLTMEQARVIGRQLDDLPVQLTPDQKAKAEVLFVELGENTDPGGIRKAARKVLAGVCPEPVETHEQLLQRRRANAWKNRSLSFSPSDNGITRFQGALPDLEAAEFRACIDSYKQFTKRNKLEAANPDGSLASGPQLGADALLSLIRDVQAKKSAPSNGGDRPKIIAVMRYDELAKQARKAGLPVTKPGPVDSKDVRVRHAEGGVPDPALMVGAGCGTVNESPISAAELRMLCCDAEIVPVVLGTRSEVLDVGRANRLVTPGIRNALNLRDGGCVFPGCDVGPSNCEAHHILPWQVGGATSLDNLASLCRHHHGVIEPSTSGPRDQWVLRIGDDGIPEVIPPSSYRDRSPQRHQRFRLRDDAASHGNARGVQTGESGRDGAERPALC